MLIQQWSKCLAVSSNCAVNVILTKCKMSSSMLNKYRRTQMPDGNMKKCVVVKFTKSPLYCFQPEYVQHMWESLSETNRYFINFISSYYCRSVSVVYLHSFVGFHSGQRVYRTLYHTDLHRDLHTVFQLQYYKAFWEPVLDQRLAVNTSV